ncbi:MAG: PqqD family protein [Prevotella sp.]|nr:PqqD family protein [Prevotellaceae bacterium]MDY3365884.1 PqqD family protein [Prevotella sp.]MDY3852551.1 PqqD family protein [Prevotella sp.]
MKIKKGFNLRNVCGEQVLVAEGKENIDFSNLISMNESSAYLWESIGDREFTVEYLVEQLLKEYEVDQATAQADVQALVQQWKEAEIIED